MFRSCLSHSLPPVETCSEKHLRRVRQLFDAKSAAWDAKYSEGVLQNRLALFRSEIQRNYPSAARILDFGCGSGVYLVDFAKLGYEICGLDCSPKMIEHCRRKLRQHALDVPLYCGPIDELVDVLGTFDVVLCASVLEYLLTPSQTLRRLGQLLNSQGRVLLTVPNFHSRIRTRQRWLKRYRPVLRALAFHARLQNYLDFLDVSLNSYTPTSLSDLAQSSGLEIELWSYFDTRCGTRSQTQRRRGEMIYAVLGRCSA